MNIPKHLGQRLERSDLPPVSNTARIAGGAKTRIGGLITAALATGAISMASTASAQESAAPMAPLATTPMPLPGSLERYCYQSPELCPPLPPREKFITPPPNTYTVDPRHNGVEPLVLNIGRRAWVKTHIPHFGSVGAQVEIISTGRNQTTLHINPYTEGFNLRGYETPPTVCEVTIEVFDRPARYFISCASKGAEIAPEIIRPILSAVMAGNMWELNGIEQWWFESPRDRGPYLFPHTPK